MEEPLADPLRRLVDEAAIRLARSGYRLPPGVFGDAAASILAAHLTGYEPLYEYVADAYSSLKREAYALGLAAAPRWRPLLDSLGDEAEAMAAFEEALAGDAVELAEPILAAALCSLASPQAVPLPWLKAGASPEPGQQPLLASSGADARWILVPRSLYMVAASVLAARVEELGSPVVLVAPDPAGLRGLGPERFLEEAAARVSEAARLGVEEACASGFLAIKYVFRGAAECSVEYLCRA